MDIIGVLVVATVLIVALFKRWRTLFVLVLLGIIMVSGAFVNQFLVAFLLSMEKLAVEVEEINKRPQPIVGGRTLDVWLFANVRCAYI